MANLLSCATGNFTSSSTWALLVGSTSFVNSETASSWLTTDPTAGRSSTFVPGAVTIDAIGVKVAVRASTPSGTMTVALYNDGAGSVVAGTSVTIDVADVPSCSSAESNGGWIIFKFASPVTLLAATNYRVQCSTSVTSQVTLWSSATTNWSRMLRTTTTQAPAAGDDLTVAGEHTGQGTGSDIVVTMNETATTDYGSAPTAVNSLVSPCGVCKRGTLKWADGSAANPLLRLSNSLIVYSGGALNIGTVATPIPRDSTAVLQFDCESDGHFGLTVRRGGVCTMQGLSRTSGKNVVKARALGGWFTGNLTNGSPTISGVSDFTNVAVGDYIQRVAPTTEVEVASFTSGSTISSMDTGAGTITVSSNAGLTQAGVRIMTGPVSSALSFRVDEDTGWLSGDHIAVASTTRTNSHCEVGKLTSNAGASLIEANGWTAAAATQVWPLTGTGGMLATHGGRDPISAEVILLTRNVKVHAVANDAVSYVNVKSGTTIDIDWTEFYHLGENTTNKRGFEISADSANFNIDVSLQYCSIHDCEDFGLYVVFTAAQSIDLLEVQHCVFWNLGAVSGPGIQWGNTAINDTDWTFHDNVAIRGLSNALVTFGDQGGTITDNIVVGSAGNGISFSETSATFGTCSGNVVHSNASFGMSLSSGAGGVMSDTMAWRNGGAGLSAAAVIDLVLEGFLLFGNGSNSINYGVGQFRMNDVQSAGDATFATTALMTAGTTGSYMILEMMDLELLATDNFYQAHTTGVSVTSGSAGVQMDVVRGIFNVSGDEFSVAVAGLSENSWISSQMHDGTAGNHLSLIQNGCVQADSTIYRTASPSVRMTPAASSYLTTSTGVTVTLNSAVITNVQSYVFDWVEVGDWTASIGFAAGARVASFDAGARTITMDRAATTGSASTTLTLYRGWLPSARKGRGFLIPAAAGQTYSVGVWVRKQQENLFTYSEDYSNAVWTKSSVTLTPGQADWAGGTSATQVLESIATSQHGISRGSAVTEVTLPATFSFHVKGVGRQWIRFQESGRDSWVDLTNGVAGTVHADHDVDVESLGSGWYRVTVVCATAVPASIINIYIATADGSQSTFAGDVTKGILLGGIQLEHGTTAGPYQATTSSGIAGYGGSEPRLVQRANPAIGIDADVVIDAASGGANEWEQLSGTTTAPSGDAGAIEIVVECEGLRGYINVDDFTVG